MFLKLSLVALIALVGSVSCSVQGRVVNGITSNIKNYPFMVSLRYSEGRHFCGGTIVNERFILTAAHCVSNKLVSELSIQYGKTVINDDNKNVIDVKNIILHEGFERLRKDDIALLELEKPIPIDSKKVRTVKKPVAFFEVPQTKEGALGVLLGWGAKSNSGTYESNLREVKLKIYSDEECQSRIAYTTTKELCAGEDKGGKGACFGDSGGPLLSKDNVQLGIISYGGIPCASSLESLTKVSHYMDWIDKHSKLVLNI